MKYAQAPHLFDSLNATRHESSEVKRRMSSSVGEDYEALCLQRDQLRWKEREIMAQLNPGKSEPLPSEFSDIYQRLAFLFTHDPSKKVRR